MAAKTVGVENIYFRHEGKGWHVVGLTEAGDRFFCLPSLYWSGDGRVHRPEFVQTFDKLLVEGLMAEALKRVQPKECPERFKLWHSREGFAGRAQCPECEEG